MTEDERKPLGASFAQVRRGFDPEQVTEHLDRLNMDIQVLADARDTATEQATQLREQLDAARDEVERLRGEVRVLSGDDDSVESMSERLQLMLRLVQDKFDDMQGAVRREVDDLSSLRERLAQQIDGSRQLLDRALPDARRPARDFAKNDGHQKPDAASTATSDGNTSAQ